MIRSTSHQRFLSGRTLAAVLALQMALATSPVLAVDRGAAASLQPVQSTGHSADACRDDVRELVRILDETHPDPYLGGGGRVNFFRRVDGILRAIPPAGLSRRDFYRLLRPLVASVRDGHTGIWPGAGTSSGTKTAIDFNVVGQELYVAKVYRPTDRRLLGGRLRAVNGIAWPALVERMKAFQGYDNEYGNLTHLAQTLGSGDRLADFLGLESPPAAMECEIELPNGQLLSARIPVLHKLPLAIEPASRIALPAANAADLGWAFIGPGKAVAYLRIDSMMRYREAFECWRAAGSDRADQLEQVAGSATNQPLPADEDSRIALVPSATETFQELFAAMRKARSRALIVDLRRNGGGSSVMDDILGYFLFPLETLAVEDHGYQIRRFSKLYFEYNRAESLAKTRSDLNSPYFDLGDFDFSRERFWQQAQHTRPDHQQVASKVKDFVADAADLPTFAKELKTRDWAACWHGKIVVLTSAHTYSAGFDMAEMLYRHGATLVGVPSGQAGNCFIDQLSTELPNSHFELGISYKRSLLFPDDPLTGEVLRPKVQLSYGELARLHFDPNASVILALRLLRALQGADHVGD